MQVAAQAAALHAAVQDRDFTVAVAQRREATLLDVAAKHEQLYRFEVDRLQRLYVYDMQVRACACSLPGMHAAASPSWHLHTVGILNSGSCMCAQLFAPVALWACSASEPG